VSILGWSLLFLFTVVNGGILAASLWLIDRTEVALAEARDLVAEATKFRTDRHSDGWWSA
jgi:hypothetical protein